jgi:serine/threonine-protein kinase RsbW
MISENKIQLILPSIPENINQVENFIEDICDEYNINNTYFGNILVALTEAVENAMKHGNGNNPEKNIQIIFSLKPVGLSFLVKDEGKGFDISQIPDPTDLDTDPKELKGRGIFLIRTLADEIHYTNNGKSLEIIFKISSIDSEIAIDRISRLKKYSAGEGQKKIISSQNKLSS